MPFLKWVCLSVCPSMDITIATEHKELRTYVCISSITHTLVGIENGTYRFTVSATAHMYN